MNAALDKPLLEIERLEVEFDTRRGVVRGLRGVDLTIGRGETLAIVGESGSGKSVTAQAVMGLIDVPGRISGGDIRWKGHSLLTRAGARMARDIRGKEIALVFQDPMTSLNPLIRVGGADLRGAAAASQHDAGRRRPPHRSNCSRRWASRRRRDAPTSIRTSCPAACASA